MGKENLRGLLSRLNNNHFAVSASSFVCSDDGFAQDRSFLPLCSVKVEKVETLVGNLWQDARGFWWPGAAPGHSCSQEVSSPPSAGGTGSWVCRLVTGDPY